MKPDANADLSILAITQRFTRSVSNRASLG
jgi:hypothetical protein